MGYTTNFTGKFTVTPPLSPERVEYLKQFGHTRRMQRTAKVAATFPDPVREAVGLPIGHEGEYFVGAQGWAGQDRDESVVDFNSPPSTQPGLWCQWTPSDNGKTIQWDGGEKFYAYEQWLSYITTNFLKPWGHQLNGAVKWRGEDSSDRGVLLANNNKISSLEGEAFAQYKQEQRAIKQSRQQNKEIHTEVDTQSNTPASPKTIKI